MEQLDHFDIIKRLCEHGFEAYIVGGAVRDLIEGHEPSDFDVVTKATPDEICAIFSDFDVNLVGKSFGVVFIEGIEVATYRADSYPDSNGAKNCRTEFAETLEDDVARRDLTINALSLCPISGDILDYHGGLSDLQRKLIRFVGDPNERIKEDPNRIIRACRFLAKIQGRFERNTFKALKNNAFLVKSSVDPERIGKEIKKAMELEQPSLFFSALALIGALDYIFPGISKMVNHPHGTWHKETVWEHAMLAGDHVKSKFPIVRLAAFLHDVGKPEAFLRENNGTFVNHEVIGADLVDSWLKKLRFSNDERETVVGLVKSHMWGGGREELTPKAIRKLRFKLHELNVHPKDWLRLRIADRSANLLKDYFTISDIKQRARVVGVGTAPEEAQVFTTHDLALTGGSVIAIFNLKPGPIISKIQKHLLMFVVDNGFECNTQEVLIEETSKYLNNLEDVSKSS